VAVGESWATRQHRQLFHAICRRGTIKSENCNRATMERGNRRRLVLLQTLSTRAGRRHQRLGARPRCGGRPHGRGVMEVLSSKSLNSLGNTPLAWSSRVERWRGGLGQAYLLPALSRAGASRVGPCPVSTSRSSNRTGGFPASGSRTRTQAFAHEKPRVRTLSRTRPSS
jgi:hypothetical protein